MVRAIRRWLPAAIGVLIALAPELRAEADQRLPIFDAHIHYSRAAWDAYPPAAALAILEAAGVPRALVSSTPDDGTLRLHAAAPQQVVPVLRPYRDRTDMADWFRNQEVLDYVKERIERGRYQGLGEFHLMDVDATDTPQMRELSQLAGERGLFLHVHSGAGPIEALFAMEPELKILWAHAGMSEPPDVVGALLDRHANLWAELSFRAWDVAPGGSLDPAWKALLRRHADRFMIGSDTYVTTRWESYEAVIAEHRAWLAQLPSEAAEAIAYGNAVRLFGAGSPGAWGKNPN